MASHHARSASFPSRSHPVAEQFEEHLCRLRSSQTASTSSSSLSHKLGDLTDLYVCVEELLQLPLNQQTLSHAKGVEEVLDGSLNLLDICSISRDILLQSKGCLQDIQSLLRRRCSGELSITSEVAEYLKIRKMAKKTIKNCLKSIKETDKCNEENNMVRLLKDVEEISTDVFKSLLSYIAGVNLKPRSIFSKFTHKNSDDKAATMSEFDALDAAFDSLICQKKKSGIDMSQIENMRSQIMKLESQIQHLVEALDCLSRHLIKTRAHLLNVLST